MTGAWRLHSNKVNCYTFTRPDGSTVHFDPDPTTLDSAKELNELLEALVDAANGVAGMVADYEGEHDRDAFDLPEETPKSDKPETCVQCKSTDLAAIPDSPFWRCLQCAWFGNRDVWAAPSLEHVPNDKNDPIGAVREICDLAVPISASNKFYDTAKATLTDTGTPLDPLETFDAGVEHGMANPPDGGEAERFCYNPTTYGICGLRFDLHDQYTGHEPVEQPTEAPHPGYGDCDALGIAGGCSECQRLAGEQ